CRYIGNLSSYAQERSLLLLQHGARRRPARPALHDWAARPRLRPGLRPPPPADAPRRRPRRDPAPARRGAAERLPGDAGARAAERGRLAPEPRLGLPRAAAPRLRGPDPWRL